MTTHRLEPDERTLHGFFSRGLAPVLTVDSGDTVVLRTLDAGWHLEPPRAPGVPGRTIEHDRPGHALCGPILVRGAEPGLTLEVRIGRLRPGTWGATFAGGRRSHGGRGPGRPHRQAAAVHGRDRDAAGRARRALDDAAAEVWRQHR